MAKPLPACRVCRRELQATERQDSYCPDCRKLVDAKRGIKEQATADAADRKKHKKKLKQLLAKSQTRDPFERLPVYLSFTDTELLEAFFKVYDPTHPLLAKLEQIKQTFFDDIARRHEIEAREKSNAWWDQPENWVNAALRNERMAYAKKVKRSAQGIENIKEANKRRRRKREVEIAALTSEEYAKLAAANGVHLPGNVGEQFVDLGHGDVEHAGSTGPTVPGDEGKRLEGEQLDGGSDG